MTKEDCVHSVCPWSHDGVASCEGCGERQTATSRDLELRRLREVEASLTALVGTITRSLGPHLREDPESVFYVHPGDPPTMVANNTVVWAAGQLTAVAFARQQGGVLHYQRQWEEASSAALSQKVRADTAEAEVARLRDQLAAVAAQCRMAEAKATDAPASAQCHEDMATALACEALAGPWTKGKHGWTCDCGRRMMEAESKLAGANLRVEPLEQYHAADVATIDRLWEQRNAEAALADQLAQALKEAGRGEDDPDGCLLAAALAAHQARRGA